MKGPNVGLCCFRTCIPLGLLPGPALPAGDSGAQTDEKDITQGLAPWKLGLSFSKPLSLSGELRDGRSFHRERKRQQEGCVLRGS